MIFERAFNTFVLGPFLLHPQHLHDKIGIKKNIGVKVMERENLMRLGMSLSTFAVFDKLLEDSVISEMKHFLELDPTTTSQEIIKQYTRFVSELYAATSSGNLTEYLWNRLLEDENLYIRCGGEVPSVIMDACEHELKCLEALSQIKPEMLQKRMDYDGFLPSWVTMATPLKAMYMERAKNVSRLGYGMYANHTMFTVKDGALLPVKTADPIQLTDLKGYEKERQMVIDNTRALVEAKIAANTLLYGDAGTGKSSTIKAVANAFADEGLRLIEVPKREMNAIPLIVAELSENPLKFIFFIDDLSFTQEGDDMSALKTILEGSAAAKTDNIAIYATSKP